MRSAIRDNKYLLAVVFLFTLLFPLIGFFSDSGSEYDVYAFVDEIVPDLFRFAVWSCIAFSSGECLIFYNKNIRCAVSHDASLLARKNGKRAAILDVRDARIHLLLAESSILDGDSRYGLAVADRIRATRRDLFLKSPRLRYVFARTLLVQAILDDDTEAAKRILADLSRAQAAMRPFWKYVSKPEKELFQAVVRVLDDGTQDDIQKLIKIAGVCPLPIRQALALEVVRRRSVILKDLAGQAFWTGKLKQLSGDTAFMKQAGCNTLGYWNNPILKFPVSPVLIFRAASGLLAAIFASALVTEVAADLWHAQVAWSEWGLIAIATVLLAVAGLVKPVRKLAAAALAVVVLLGLSTLAFGIDFITLESTLRLAPAVSAETVSGVDLATGDSEVFGVEYEWRYDILTIKKAVIRPRAAVLDALEARIAAS